MPDAVLLTVAGLQLPVTPLFEVSGRAGTEAPEQITSEFPKSNTGVVFGVTVTVKSTGMAQTPAAGVKV